MRRNDDGHKRKRADLGNHICPYSGGLFTVPKPIQGTPRV